MEEKDIKRTIDIVVENEKYTVKFPTVGDFLSIERYKQTLSAGQYSSMVASGLVSAGEALDLIDMIAYFTVLIPTLKEHLKVGMFSDLDLMDAKNLVQIYKKEMKPWIDGWMKIFNNPPAKEEEVKKEG